MSFIELKRDRQYHGPIFDVIKVQTQLPDGRKRSYDLVEHGDSITILPVDEQGAIWFVTQHRIGAGCSLLELPAGVLDPGESPMDCAQREIREEIGMAAKNWTELGAFYLAPGYMDEYMTVFLATGLSQSPVDPDEDEFITIKKIPVNEVYQKVDKGDFHDGKTLAALLLAMRLLKSDL